jgi:signal transduction histidine kinase
MRDSLLKKFILIYLLVAMLGFVAITYICSAIDYASVKSALTGEMYEQAVAIAREYADSYFSEEKVKLIRSEMKIISDVSGRDIMFITTDGTIVMDTWNEAFQGQELDSFDYASLNGSYAMTGTFFHHFNQEMVSVIAPIANAYTIKGYVAIHITSDTIREKTNITFNTNYVAYLIMMLLILIFVLFYFLQIHRPLVKITTGVKEYAKGNFNYRIDLSPGDELHHLGDSLNYMSNELNEMDKFQQTFLSNISHDFRSPLTSIKGYLEAMEDGTIPPEMASKYIQIVLFETERLTKLTNNILTLNDLDPKSARLNQTDFDIHGIIRHTIETFEGTCKSRKISFKLKFESKELVVHADMERIQQVIYNLVDNAIKFSPTDSTIFISTNTKGEKAFISVKDSGCGISRDNISKIWDRFYKSDSSRGRDKKGSGLGLAIVKEVINAHGEHIDVISTEGIGTEFIFSLRLATR